MTYRFMQLALAWFAAPLAWAVHLGLVYAMADWACEHDARWTLYAITLGALLLALAGVLASLKSARRNASGEAARPFLGRSGLWMSILFLLVILVQSIPIVVVDRQGEPAWFALDPWSWLLLIASALFYLNGRRVLRGRARSADSQAARHGALLFCCGWPSLAIALGPSLDPLGGYLFSAHMLQHELLMLVAAPLLVLSRPGGILLWGLPSSARRLFGGMRRIGWLRSGWAWLSSAHGAWLVHAAILWGWHLPALFDASVLHDGVHALQHASFFSSALLFWWALLHGSGARNAGAVIYVFTTAVHSSLLGALLTFSPSVWYAPYLETTALFGLSPLDDQQLGGLIMWVPSGLVFLAAGLLLTARFLRDDSNSALVERNGGKGDD